MKYTGYQPLLNCCIKEKNHFQDDWYLCKSHGWKKSYIKAEGEQFKLGI